MKKEICWNITARCNQNCKYCHRFQNIKDLKFEENLLILNKLKNANINSITWTGGEALILEEIDGLLKISHENKINNKLITNGKLLTKNRIDKIYKYLDSITLSIDSIDDEINNTLGRGINHFQEIKEILDSIHEKKYNVKVRINSVICKNNLETINKLVDFLNEYNIYSWRLFKFMPLREKAIINKNIFDITLDEYNNVIFYIKNNSNIRKIDTRVEEDMEKKYILILANGDIIKTESGKDKKIGVSVKSFVVKS